MRPAAFLCFAIYLFCVYIDKNTDCGLTYKYSWKAKCKFFVANLVVKGKHSRNSAGASADSRKDEEISFWNTPFLMYGLIFVNAHGYKRRDIYYRKPQPKNIQGILLQNIKKLHLFITLSLF
jgi:hypothetical protein